MKTNEILQKEILRRKISNFFSKNPSQKSAIFKSESFGGKLYWKVDKTKKGYSITEVKTNKDKFMLEAVGDDDDWDKMSSDNGKLPKTPFRDVDFPSKPSRLAKTVPDGQAGGKSVDPRQRSGTNIEPEFNPNEPKKAKSLAAAKVSSALAKAKSAVQNKVGGLKRKAATANMERQTKNTMQWNPSSPDSQSRFNKTLAQTKSLQKALTSIPQNDFKGFAGFTGAKNAGELLRDKQKMSNFLQHHGQNNPLLGRFSESFNRAMLSESPEFARMSTDFTKSMSFPLDHQKLSAALKAANAIVGRLADPQEKSNVATMIGVLTNLVDSTTNQMSRGKTTISSGKNIKGRQLREGTKEDDQNEIPSHKKKEKAAVDLNKMLPGEDDKDPEGVEDPHVDNTSDSELPPSQDMDGAKEISPEQKIISDKLGGQSIEDASLEFATDAVSVKLQLVGMKNPAILQIFKSGKVKFIYKGRPYLVKKD